ncbi:putative molybdenum ion binding protein [Apodospora peruviana]|uniref:Molybdenum ion binding protein n=1 Tax=Apodospora peruviana TaxID=516989 RepID=A0AAE0M3Y2_9PEZI|nr:putative molybdenum ion binding protein [Apodospora peruviana]
MDEKGSVLRSGPAVDAGGIFLVLLTILVFFLPIFIFFPPTRPSCTEAILQTHSRAGLDPSESGLGSGPSSGSGPGSKPASAQDGPGKIRSIFIYPVKSCKGIELKRSKVLPAGLKFDRLFTFAQLKSPFPVRLDASDAERTQHEWEFITQRQFPLLATVQVDLYLPDIVKSSAQQVKSSDAFLVLRFPWRKDGLRGTLGWISAKLTRGRHALPEKEILLPVTFPPEDEIRERGYTFEQVRIWRDTITALSMETELPRELRLYLGVSNRLGIFRIDPARLRQVHRCAPTKADAGYQPVTGFQDAYPLHLLNLASVRDLDAKIEKDNNLKVLDPRRFRANIIVDGVDAYEEESWKTICFKPGPKTSRREKSRFHVSCRTVRCKLPNVNPDNGYRHPVEPDKSLRKFREVDEGAKGKGCLGMQLTPLFDKVKTADDMESWVEVGMSVEVLGKGSHTYIVQ